MKPRRGSRRRQAQALKVRATERPEIDLRDLANVDESDWQVAFDRALEKGEKVAQARAMMRSGGMRTSTTLKVVIAECKRLLADLEAHSGPGNRGKRAAEEPPEAVLEDVEEIEESAGALEARHERHGSAGCDCAARSDQLFDLWRAKGEQYLVASAAQSAAKRAAEALFPIASEAEQRWALCTSMSRAARMLSASERPVDDREDLARVLAADIIEHFCSSMPELGRRIRPHRAAIARAISASATTGRPRAGADHQDADDIRLKLLALIGLATTANTLKSDRKRRRLW